MPMPDLEPSPAAWDTMLTLPADRVFDGPAMRIGSPAIAIPHDLDRVHRTVEAWIEDRGLRATYAAAGRRVLWALAPAPTDDGRAMIRVRLPIPLAQAPCAPVCAPPRGDMRGFWMRVSSRKRIYDQADREAMLSDLAAKSGFEIVELDRIETGQGVIRRLKRRNGERFSLAEGDLVARGTLRVSDAQTFARALVDGIGRARAFGFGLLVLDPPPSN